MEEMTPSSKGMRHSFMEVSFHINLHNNQVLMNLSVVNFKMSV